MWVPKFLPGISEAQPQVFESIRHRNDRLSSGSGWKGKVRGHVCLYSSTYSLQKLIILPLPPPTCRCLLSSPYSYTARSIPSWALPAQSKTNQAEPYNLLHQTGITPTHLKNLASFQGNSSSALAGLSQRGWSVTCGKNIELIRFNKTKFHTRLEGLSQQRPGGVTAGSPQIVGETTPSKSKALSSLRSHERPTGCPKQTGEVLESGRNLGGTNAAL